jgi:hypothetical protein
MAALLDQSRDGVVVRYGVEMMGVLGWRTLQDQALFGGRFVVIKSCYMEGKLLPTGEGNCLASSCPLSAQV